ncbi:MAG TPA: response regulator transcription factor [Catenuloplanes sp.]
MIRIAVADDQELVRAGFEMILAAQPDLEIVGLAADGAEAITLAGAVRPDVLLLDIRMPRLDGLAALPLILAASPGTKVLMLTTFDLDEYVYDALRGGASGFLLKDVRRDRLVEAVRVVAGGDALLDPTVTRRLIADFVAARPSPTPTAAADLLTTRERETLLLLARGRTNAQIAAELFISEHTVKTHVANVLMKLNLRDRIHAVIHAYETGLVRPG